MEEEGLLGALSQAASATGRGLINPLGTGQLTQVDLNDPTQLGDLEDAGLMSHMDEARAQLAEQERTSALLVNNSMLAEMETEGRSSLSNLMLMLREQRTALAATRDSIFLHASNAAKLAAGITPHSYPPKSANDPAGVRSVNAVPSTSANPVRKVICNELTSQHEVQHSKRRTESPRAGCLLVYQCLLGVLRRRAHSSAC